MRGVDTSRAIGDDEADADSPVDVLVVDGHPLTRLGLRTVLSAEPGLTVRGEAGSLDEAVQRAGALNPQAILAFLRSLTGSVGQAVRALTAVAPNSAILVVVGKGREDEAAEAVSSGARGYIPEDASARLLASALLIASGGGSVMLPTDGGAMTPHLPRSPAVVPDFSDRERAVVHLLALGLSNREIAAELVLAPTTIKKYVSQAMHKLGCADRLRAGLLAYQLGFAAPTTPAGPAPLSIARPG
jgi:DNA-binding NarL/FixJ family response regulator